MTDPFEILVSDDWKDYTLVDSGEGRKLERFGRVTVDRPDAQALWPSQTPRDSWRADAVFDSGGDDEERGKWVFPGRRPPESWPIAWGPLKLHARCAAFRHMGVFPEHSVHWSWAAQKIRAAKRPIRLLNVFGYTGMMSLAAAEAGAEVVHVDASPKSIGHGRENQALSGLSERPIRWICDDAMKFLEREVRRGRTYDALVLDPPKYGRGPKNEVWRFEQDFPALLQTMRALLSDQPLFAILTVYAVRLSFLSVGQALSGAMDGANGRLGMGEMCIRENGRGFALPTGLFARMEW
ncbi:MAG: class I SAM-dependent methyltransferase [Hyphomonadaceae bacterium]